VTDVPCDSNSLCLTISLFENERATSPHREETTWAELKARLSRFALRDGKSGPAWSPVRYAEGASRGNTGVECVSVTVMDVDDGTDPAEVHRRLGGLGFEHVIHSTHSSTPEHPKFRAIVPLGNPCSASSWPGVFPRLCTLLTDGHTDPDTKDPARLFYLPSAKPGGKTFTYSGHGRAVLPADLPTPTTGETNRAPAVSVGGDSKIPHGRHHDTIRSVAASVASRIGGLDEPGLLAAVRGALAPLLDDLEQHDADIQDAVRSALDKFGKPAPEPPEVTAVDGAVLFAEVRAALERHVYFPEPWEYDLAALYVFQCWIANVLPAYFYVFFDGTKGAGKTTVLDHLSRLTDSLRLQSFTLATLSRSMTKYRHVSIDEFDEVERDPEMGGTVAALVRQGYKRDGAPRKVCAPKSNEVVDLETAGPKALTFRGDLDDALKDRGIRFPMARGSSYRMVLLGMAPELGSLPARLKAWASLARAEWSFERASARIKEPSHEEKVRAVLDVLEAGRNEEIVTVAVLVAEVVGIDLTTSLRDAKAAKDRDEGVSRGVEELLDALCAVTGRKPPKLGEAEFYLVSPKEVRAEMDRARKDVRMLPIKNHELARFRKDARIMDDWRVTIRGRDYWKIPTAFIPHTETTGVLPPSAPLAPSRQDDRVPRVDRVPIPLPPESGAPVQPSEATGAQVRAAARSAFDEAARQEGERP